eukprot:UN23756
MEQLPIATTLVNVFNKQHFIPKEEITLKKKLGSGAFGYVYLADWEDAPVAVKIMKINQDQSDIIKEAHLLDMLSSHP